MHWKTRRLVQWAAGRRFVWADDEITDTDRMWVAAKLLNTYGCRVRCGLCAAGL